jgi:hypothetical protein
MYFFFKSMCPRIVPELMVGEDPEFVIYMAKISGLELKP